MHDSTRRAGGGGGGMQPGAARFTIPAPSAEASPEGEEAGELRLSKRKGRLHRYK